MSPAEKLVSLFGSRNFRTRSDLGWKQGRWPRGREEAIAELQLAGRLVAAGGRYYLDASPEREAERIESVARKSVQLLTEKALSGGGSRVPAPPFFREALESLVDQRRLLRWEVAGESSMGFVYLHRERLPGGGEVQEPEGVEEKILAAYKIVSTRDKSPTIWISDLVAQSGLSVQAVHEWIRRRVISEGWGTLDEADWPSATDVQRAAYINHLDRRRLYIRLHL